MRLVRANSGSCLIMRFLMACVGITGSTGCVEFGGVESDAPCIVVSEWGLGTMHFRRHSGGILITEITVEDREADFSDGGLDYAPHRVVYSFDVMSESFLPAPDHEWDESDQTVTVCCSRVNEVGDFAKDGRLLRFDGELVDLGGANVISMSPTESQELVAVLSTDGFINSFNVASGQHFHQVFDVHTGVQVGPTLRLGVGGRENTGVLWDWSDDNRFVVYSDGLNVLDINGARVCVIDREREESP